MPLARAPLAAAPVSGGVPTLTRGRPAGVIAAGGGLSGAPPPKRACAGDGLGSSGPSGRWYSSVLDPRFFSEQIRELSEGVALEFVVFDSEQQERGTAVIIVTQLYLEGPEGLTVEGRYISASSKACHEHFASLSQGRQGNIVLHLCNGPVARCGFTCTGVPLSHSHCWRARLQEDLIEDWVTAGPSGEATPPGPGGGAAPGTPTPMPPRPGGLGPSCRLGVGGGVGPLGGPVADVLRDPIMERVAAMGARLGQEGLPPPGSQRAAAAEALDGEPLSAQEAAAAVSAARADTELKLPAFPPLLPAPLAMPGVPPPGRELKPAVEGAAPEAAGSGADRSRMLKDKLEAARTKLDQKAGRSGVKLTLAERAAARVADTPQAKRKKAKAKDPKEEDPESSSEEEGHTSKAKGIAQLDTTNSFVEYSRERPGALYKAGLTNMVKFLAPRGGAEAESCLQPRAVEYLTTVGPVALGQAGLRNERELRTLAESIDQLAAGRLEAVGDILMQRFRAVEKAVQDNGWETARHLEIIPPALPTTLSDRERAQALQMRIREQKVAAAGRGPVRERSPH